VSQLVPIGSPALQALAAAAGERASMHFLEFFAANICDAQSVHLPTGNLLPSSFHASPLTGPFLLWTGMRAASLPFL